jgi:GNAT superfamily N-acetyltransferase
MTPTAAVEVPALHLPRALGHLHSQLLSLEQAETVLALRREILTAMPAALRAIDPALGCLPAVEHAWALQHLGPGARTLGVFDGPTLVALACLRTADPTDPDDPAHLLSLPAADWARTAHMAVCLVAEAYRGLKLQSRLLNWRRELAVRQGRTLLMAMTACGNGFSRRNLLAAGLGIHWVGAWRPGTAWYAMLQDLGPEGEPPSDHDHEWVSVSHLERQAALLAAGYVGVAEMGWHGSDRRQEPRLQFVRRDVRLLRPQVPALRAA